MSVPQEDESKDNNVSSSLTTTTPLPSFTFGTTANTTTTANAGGDGNLVVASTPVFSFGDAATPAPSSSSAPAFVFSSAEATTTAKTTPTSTPSPTTTTTTTRTSSTPRRTHGHHRGGGGVGHKKKHQQQSSPSSSPSFLFLPTTTSSPTTVDVSSQGEGAAANTATTTTASAAAGAAELSTAADAALSFHSVAHKTELSLEARQSPLYQALCRVVHRSGTFPRSDKQDRTNMTALAEQYCTEDASMSVQIACHFLFFRSPGVHPRDVAAGRDAYGRTPLHICVHHGADVEVIVLLLDIYPEAAYQKDNRNSVPLQVPFRAGGGVGEAGTTPDSSLFATLQLKVVQALLQAHPAAAFQEAASQYVGPSYFSENRTPKFLQEMAIEGQAAMFSVGKTSKPMQRVRHTNDGSDDDEDAHNGSDGGSDASHSEEKNEEEIRASNNVPFKAAHVPGKKLSLLHLAVANSTICEAGVLDAILEANPASALELDNVGRTPLHLLLTPTSPLQPCTELGPSSNRHSVILTLLGRQSPPSNATLISPREVASIQDVLGRTPLHMACHHGVEDPQVLQALLEAHPEALVTRDKSGQTPLHLAFTGLAASHRISLPDTTQAAISLPLISSLLRAHPRAARIEIENRQQMALHLAAIQGAHCQDGVFQAVLQAHPAALLQQDFSGRMPLHLLLASLSSPELAATEAEASSVSERVIGLVRHLLVRPKKEEQDAQDATRARTMVDPLPDPATIAAGKDASGSMALHIACFHGAPFEELIQLLLRVYPQAAHQVDNSGNLPIHLALSCVPVAGRRSPSLSRSGTTDVIRLLLQANPHTTAGERKGAVTPLHVAASHASHFQVQVFDMLQQANPSLVLHPDAYGQTPLHRLFAATSSSSSSLAKDDDQDRQQDKKRFLQQMSILLREAQTTWNPTCDAPGTKSPTTTGEGTGDAAAAVNQASTCQTWTTNAAAAKNKKGWTPLHVAVSVAEHCNVEVLEALLQACPAAASSRDGEDRLPLHAMLSNITSSRLQLAPLERLLQAYPPAILETDKSGDTPLHLLLKQPCLDNIFEFLLKAGPEAAVKCDKSGATPLHVALSKWSGGDDNDDDDYYSERDKKNDLDPDLAVSLERVVSRILEVCPQAIRARHTDKGHETCPPLYVAVQKNHDQSVVERLLGCDPDAAAEVFAKQRHTPLSLALSLNYDNDSTCRLLLTHCPQSARTLVMGNKTVLHLSRRLNLLEDLLEAWPESLFQQCGRHGWTPLHMWMWSGTFGNLHFPEPEGLLRALLRVKTWDGDKFLQALQLTDHGGLTPLHHALARYAVGGQVYHETVRRALEGSHFTMMLRSFPGVLFKKVEPPPRRDDDSDDRDDTDGERRVDLHISSIMASICELSTAAELVQALFNEFADFAPQEKEHDAENDKEEDHDPLAVWFLQKACEHSDGHGSMALVRLCHDRYPACVRKPSKVGDLPLHMACRQSLCRLELVQLLIELYGAALTLQDGSGQVPFEIACWNDAPLDVTFYLLRSAPDVIL